MRLITLIGSTKSISKHIAIITIYQDPQEFSFDATFEHILISNYLSHNPVISTYNLPLPLSPVTRPLPPLLNNPIHNQYLYPSDILGYIGKRQIMIKFLGFFFFRKGVRYSDFHTF